MEIIIWGLWGISIILFIIAQKKDYNKGILILSGTSFMIAMILGVTKYGVKLPPI